MMTVERKKSEKYRVEFANLKVGEVYRDQMGRICIKLNNAETANCLTFEFTNENEWEVASESIFDEVTPLKAKLTVWEEKEM